MADWANQICLGHLPAPCVRRCANLACDHAPLHQINWGDIQTIDRAAANRRAVESFALVLVRGKHRLHERLARSYTVTLPTKGNRTMLTFQEVKATAGGQAINITRAKVPGGWLVLVAWNDIQGSSSSITFVPDVGHEWDGASLPDAK